MFPRTVPPRYALAEIIRSWNEVILGDDRMATGFDLSLRPFPRLIDVRRIVRLYQHLK